MEEKDMQKEVGQKSLEEPLDTLNLPLEYTHGVEQEDPLLKTMLFAYGKYGYPICGEKHVIRNHDVLHVIQSPLEEVDSEMNAEEELLKIKFPKIRFPEISVAEDEFLENISVQEESPPKIPLQVKMLQKGFEGTLKEFIDADCVDRIQTKHQTTIPDVVDDQANQNFGFECFEGHILMSQVDLKQGYVSVAKNWKNQIDCCSNLDRDESGKGLTYHIEHEECQEKVFKEYKIGLTGFVEQGNHLWNTK
ncbi:hypothetical protein GOP47_0030945 [Adiantum capillus-veneris]|nr:hypothetical protein GOP47_0030945 [Adiantum capillus-veneris]